MFPSRINSSSSDVARSSRPCSSKHRRRKNRKRSSSPTSLLDGDDESYDDDENDQLEAHCNSKSACHLSPSRPSPIPWTNDLHKEFVKAIFQIGIEGSSPAVIAEQMITKNSYNLPDHKPASSSSVLPNISLKNLSSVTMAAALASIGGDRDTARRKPLNHHHQSKSSEKSCENSNNDLLPEEAQYYKRELTGERLKSHLQKMRKQKVREKEVFLEDYQRCLVRKQALVKEKEQVEKLEQQRKEEARNRRRLKRKHSQQKPPSTLHDAWQHDSSSDENGIHEDVSKEEEERLLSMYLPLRSSVAIRQNDDDFDSDSNHELLFNKSTNSRRHSCCAFPVGGRAIGRVTFAVQQQEIEDRTKREQKQKQRKAQQQQQQQQKHLPSCNVWETASIDSWTSHTAIAAGKLATSLGPHGRRGAPSDHSQHRHSSSSPYDEKNSTTYDGNGNQQRIVIDCASSEDDHTEHGDGDGDLEEDDDDQFTASIPTLTEAEKSSPLGVSMRLTWDMIKLMHGVIAEERASKQQKTKTRQNQQQQQQILTKGSSPPPVSGAVAELQHLPEQPKLPSNAGFSRTENCSVERIVPSEVIHHCHNGNNNSNNNSAPAAAAWNPTTTANTNTNSNTNSHLMAAIAANGPPPSNLVATALANAFLGGKVLGSAELTGAFAPVAATKKGLVTPPHPLALADLQQFQYQQFRKQQGQQQQGGYKGSPMPPPMGVLALPSSIYPMGIPQQSRSQTSSPSLWTPTTPTDAMFRSLLQQQEQQQQQHTQLQLQQQQKQQQQQKYPV